MGLENEDQALHLMESANEIQLGRNLEQSWKPPKLDKKEQRPKKDRDLPQTHRPAGGEGEAGEEMPSLQDVDEDGAARKRGKKGKKEKKKDKKEKKKDKKHKKRGREEYSEVEGNEVGAEEPTAEPTLPEAD